MKLQRLWFTGAVIAALCGPTRVAAAQASPGLADARQAYAAVDYDGTLRLAKAAIEQGGNDRAATGELYLLWATAAAALDQAENARGAFSRALAVNPELKLDRNLSPKIRAPYQEARGAATGADGKAQLRVTLQRRGQELELALHDVLGLTESIDLATRSNEQRAFTHQRLRAQALRRVPLPNAAELQYFVILRDAHANVLLELGGPNDPQRMPGLAAARPLPPTARAGDVNATPYYVTAGTLGVLGLAAGGVATGMYFRREAAAREWNGPSCEQPGATREQQCAAVDQRRQNAEHLAMGFAATGGALLIGSVVSLLLAPSTKQASVALEAGPHDLLLRLSTTL